MVFRYNLGQTDNLKDNFYFKEILWFMALHDFQEENVVAAIKAYNNSTQSYLFKWIADFAPCLSYNKQGTITRVFSHFAKKYNPFFPAFLKSACDKKTQSNGELYKQNIFSLLSTLINDFDNDGVIGHFDDNPILAIADWLKSDEMTLNNKDIIIRMFCLLPPEKQMEIIRRYFYDLREERAKLDLNFLESLLNNKYIKFTYLYSCIYNPCKPVGVGVFLLLDTIITYVKSNYTELAEFNGILDLAFLHSDRTMPNINPELYKFLPLCNGRLAPKDDFKGFVDYQIFYELADGATNKQELREWIIGFLDRHAIRLRIETCNYDNKRVDQHCQKYNCWSWRNLDEWTFKYRGENKDVLILLSLFFDDLEQTNLNQRILLKLQNVNLHGVRGKLKKTIKEITIKEDYGLLVKSDYKKSCRYIIDKFCVPSKIEFLPNTDAYVGGRILDINDSIDALLREGYTFNDFSKYVQKAENRTLAPIIREHLMKLLKQKIKDDERIIVNYDQAVLDKVKRFFYYKVAGQNCFLTDKKDELERMQYRYFCSPHLNEKPERVTSLHFFWCMGRECYQNALELQTIRNLEASGKSWKDYSLMHIAEILGHPLIKDTGYGFETLPIISTFIAIVNKAKRVFSYLKCEDCGHLLFASKKNVLGNYSHFRCRNTYCRSYWKDVYISFCFKCKRGLIDSRKTKKCPNGMYICPSCLSCCSNEYYEKQAARYENAGMQIPRYISLHIGQGHADQGKYFCPKCGGEIKVIHDDHFDEDKYYCPNCHQELNDDKNINLRV